MVAPYSSGNYGPGGFYWRNALYSFSYPYWTYGYPTYPYQNRALRYGPYYTYAYRAYGPRRYY